MFFLSYFFKELELVLEQLMSPLCRDLDMSDIELFDDDDLHTHLSTSLHALQRNSALRSLHLGKGHFFFILSSPSFPSLRPQLFPRYLTCITLSDTSLHLDYEKSALLDALSQCPLVHHVHLLHTTFGEISPDFFSRLFLSVPRLSKLRMLGCNLLPTDIRYLANELKKKETSFFLRHLDLSFNWLEQEGVHHLSDAVTSHPTLTHLNLAGNKIPDAGILHLAEMLERNTVLKSLNLQQNLCIKDLSILRNFALKDLRILYLGEKKDEISSSSSLERFGELLGRNGTLETLYITAAHSSEQQRNFDALFRSLIQNPKSELKVLKMANVPKTNFAVILRDKILCRNLREIILSNTPIGSTSYNGVNDDVQVICDRLLGYNNNYVSLVKLHMTRCQLSDADVTWIAQCLESNATLKYLNIQGNNGGVQGAAKLGKCFERNNSLQVLDISDNHIGNEGAMLLLKGITLSCTCVLTHLKFNSNQIEGGNPVTTLLLQAAARRLQHLEIHHNQFKFNDALRISQELIARNVQMSHLNMNFNPIGAEGFRVVVESLKYNTNLSFLGLLDASGYNIILDETVYNPLYVHLLQNASLLDISMHDNNIVPWLYLCARNKWMHQRVRMSCQTIILLTKHSPVFRSWPKEMVLLLSKALWNTKCDIEAWDTKRLDLIK